MVNLGFIFSVFALIGLSGCSSDMGTKYSQESNLLDKKNAAGFSAAKHVEDMFYGYHKKFNPLKSSKIKKS